MSGAPVLDATTTKSCELATPSSSTKLSVGVAHVPLRSSPPEMMQLKLLSDTGHPLPTYTYVLLFVLHESIHSVPPSCVASPRSMEKTWLNPAPG